MVSAKFTRFKDNNIYIKAENKISSLTKVWIPEICPTISDTFSFEDPTFESHINNYQKELYDHILNDCDLEIEDLIWLLKEK
jgi:hypothetical protein